MGRKKASENSGGPHNGVEVSNVQETAAFEKHTIDNHQAPSRAGDRYHYVRTARLCLTMLAPNADLRSVAVEGPALDDPASGGEDVIDLALYYTESGGSCRIAYRQFKHSLTAVDKPMTASDLVNTLRGYASRFASTQAAEKSSTTPVRFIFEFETNRPIASEVIAAIEELRDGRRSKTSNYLRGSLPLKDDDLSDFAARVRLLPRTQSLDGERSGLGHDAAAYLPETDRDVPTRLVEMIADKAAKPNAADLKITRFDVLRLMDCDEHALLPTQSKLERPSNEIRRPVLETLLSEALRHDKPVILEAEGGVGKSVAAMQLSRLLPPSSVCVVYDCFGNGSYRDPTMRRDQPRKAFVQIINELAFQGLCDPLIPSSRAPDEQYASAFLTRIQQAALSVSAKDEAVLLIVIDAADNAEMAALEYGEYGSFARWLLRMSWPKGAHIILTTRPERRELLNPPPDIPCLVLPPFDEAESAAHLRSRHPSASLATAQAFHRLTSANPRLQHRAFENSDDLSKMLDRLGPEPLTVEGAIEALLDEAVAKARDGVRPVDKKSIDGICTALAVLRPFVPLEVVAKVAEVEHSFVISLASELGRALVINDGAVQFADEPTETWFRKRFRSDDDAVEKVLRRLQPQAAKSSYAAAAVPQLLLETGRVDELIDLVLSDSSLPDTDELGRRDVRLMRLRAATQAALRNERYVDAAKLAFKTANAEVAEERQLGLLSRNPDLAARFLAAEKTAELIATRKIGGGGWPGSGNAHQAALFAGYKRFHGDANARLGTALAWLDHHFRVRDDDERGGSGVDLDEEIVALAWARLELRGTASCADFLRSWRPRKVSFSVGRVVCSRLADAGRFEELQALMDAAGNDIFLGLAGTLELEKVGLVPDAPTVHRLFRMIADRRVLIEKLGRYEHERTELRAIIAISTAALRTHAIARSTIAKLLNRYLPALAGYELDSNWHDPSGRRDSLLKGFALRAALNGRQLTIDRLRDRKEGQRKTSSEDSQRRRGLAPLVPWYVLWAEIILGRVSASQAPATIAATSLASSEAQAQIFHEHDATLDDRMLIKAECLLIPGADASSWGNVDDWYPPPSQKGQRASTTTVTLLVRLIASDPARHALALELAARAGETLHRWRDTAEMTVEGQLSLARALLHVSEPEARAYFDAAAESTERLGEENLDRWRALLAIAEVAGKVPVDQQELAYRLARFAEPTYENLAKASYLEWDRMACALARLSPTSCLAIVSRWADRGFGVTEDQLQVLLHTLVADGHLSGITAMLVFPAHGERAATALEAGIVAGAERTAVEHIATHYVAVEDRPETTWQDVRVIADRHGFKWPWLNDAEASARRSDSRNSSRNIDSSSAVPDWDTLLAGLDITTPDGLRGALDRLRAQEGIYRRDLWRALPERVLPGYEANFLAGLEHIQEFDLYDLDALLDRIPYHWRSRLAVPPRLTRLASLVVRRSPYRIMFSAWWSRSSTLTGISNRVGVEDSVLAREALKAIAEEERIGGAAELFHVASLAAVACGAVGSGTALKFALDEMEDALRPDDGDGPWRDSLSVSGGMSQALAGYLWSMLGSPDGRRRWRAAHVVRNLARWDPTPVIQTICKRAMTGAAYAFQDVHLPFYHLHAVEWLLVALDRVAVDDPKHVACATDLLKHWARPEEKHSRLRGLAARLTLRLHRAGICLQTDDEVGRLDAMNSDRSNPDLPKAVLPKPKSNERLYYHYDSRDFLLRPLSSAFRISEDDADQRVQPIMRTLATDDTGKVLFEDPRRTRGMFRQDDRSGRNAGHRDDWSAYLSRHATMVLCGQLLDGDTPGQSANDYFGPDHFLDYQKLSSEDDATWAADRRCPVPISCRLTVDVPADKWPAQITEVDLDGLVESVGNVCVWGQWSAYAGQLVRTVSVSTALVSVETAPALLRALQTAHSPHDYRLPDNDTSFEIGSPRYVLRGWMAEYEATGDFDARDPWAGDVPLGVLRPRRWVTDRFDLHRPTVQTWSANGKELHRLRRETWSTGERYGEKASDRGDRLLASREFLADLCARTGMALLREVEVSHDVTGRDGWDGKKRRSRTSLRLIA